MKGNVVVSGKVETRTSTKGGEDQIRPTFLLTLNHDGTGVGKTVRTGVRRGQVGGEPWETKCAIRIVLYVDIVNFFRSS